jgi:hypothetical protein
MTIEVMGSKDRKWLVFGSPDGDIAVQVVAVAAIERFWFSVDDGETNVVIMGKSGWLTFDDDLVEDIERALGIKWDREAVRQSAAKET